MKEYCVMCGKLLNPKTKEQIGLSQETGRWTLDEASATQGWFDIGKDCLTSWKKNPALVEERRNKRMDAI